MENVYHVAREGLSAGVPINWNLPTGLEHLITRVRCFGRLKLEAEKPMPSLFRFLFVVGVIAGLAVGGMAALVAFVEPQPREMSQQLPASKLNR